MIFEVNGRRWHLAFVNPKSHNLRRSDGSITLGVTDANVDTVYIADNLSDEMTEKVICHELTHCICFSWGIYIPIETEEFLCDFMANHGKEIIYLLDDLLSVVMMNVA